MLKTDWNDVKILMAVAEAGSLSRAAVLTGFDVATISRTVAQMERRFGSALFERSRSGAKPTSLGVELFEASRSILSGADAVAAVLKNARRTEGDEVRVCATFGLVSAHLLPAFNGSMMDDHPMYPTAVRIDIDSLPEIVFHQDEPENADVMLMWSDHGAAPETVPWPGASVHRVGTMTFGLMSAPSYLERHGLPERLSDLRQHRLVRIDYQATLPAYSAWHDFVSGQDGVRLTNTSGLFDGVNCLRFGGGISMMATIGARVTNDLTRVRLDGMPETFQDLWLLVRPRPNPRIAKVAAIIASLFGECPDFAVR